MYLKYKYKILKRILKFSVSRTVRTELSFHQQFIAY